MTGKSTQPAASFPAWVGRAFSFWQTRAFVLSALAALAGCGSAAPIVTDQLRPLRTVTDNASGSGDDSLESRMTALAEQLENAGLSRGRIWQRGFVPSGARETLRLELPADTCATIVAMASSGIRDVDATLYLPDGTLVAQDNQPDSHPTLQVCAQGTGRYFYYTLHAYEGAGAFLVASFISDHALFARAAAVIGGRPGQAEAATLSPEEQAVATFGEGVGRRGFEPAKEPLRVVLVATQRVRVPIDVEIAHCYTVAAFALDGLEDVNLRVMDDEGNEVADDVTASREAATQFCVDRTGQFSAEVVATRGAGVSVVAVYAGAESDVGGNGGLWLGARSVDRLSRRTLEESLREDAATATQAGYSAVTVRARGSLITGEVTEHQIVLKARSCTRIAAVGGLGAGVMRLDVRETTSTVVPRRIDETRVEVCTPVASEGQVLVTSRRGYGDYAVTTSTKIDAER